MFATSKSWWQNKNRSKEPLQYGSWVAQPEPHKPLTIDGFLPKYFATKNLISCQKDFEGELCEHEIAFTQNADFPRYGMVISYFKVPYYLNTNPKIFV